MPKTKKLEAVIMYVIYVHMCFDIDTINKKKNEVRIFFLPNSEGVSRPLKQLRYVVLSKASNILKCS